MAVSWNTGSGSSTRVTSQCWGGAGAGGGVGWICSASTCNAFIIVVCCGGVGPHASECISMLCSVWGGREVFVKAGNSCGSVAALHIVIVGHHGHGPAGQLLAVLRYSWVVDVIGVCVCVVCGIVVLCCVVLCCVVWCEVVLCSVV